MEVEEEGRPFFEEALEAHDLYFRRKLEDVPEDVEILSVFISERIDEAFLAAHPALKLIATRSTGSDHIDLVACEKRAVTVANVGSYGENTVAEHTFALILALSRRLRDSEEAVRTGHFVRHHLRGFDLHGKTLGVIGTGRIGLHVIRIANGFGMKVAAYDSQPHPFYGDLLDFEYHPLHDVLRRADVITLHVPLNDQTRGLINRETLALCRPGAVLINTARGGLIDTEAVLEALDAGRLAGLGLDVIEDERVFHGGAAPILGQQIAERVHRATRGATGREASPTRVKEFSQVVTQSQLLQRHDVVLTPHVAFNSAEAVTALRRVTLENILDHLAGKAPKHLCS